MVLRGEFVLILYGIGLGVLASLALTRFLTNLLFQVKPTDPITFALVVAMLLVVAFFACLLPARRALRVDPIVALRYE